MSADAANGRAVTRVLANLYVKYKLPLIEQNCETIRDQNEQSDQFELVLRWFFFVLSEKLLKMTICE